MAKGLIGYLRGIYFSAGGAYDEEWKETLRDEADFCGSYRACFIRPNSKIVFKVPINVQGAYCCEEEFRIYEKAKEYGLTIFFAKPLKKVKVCHGVYAYMYEYVEGIRPEGYLPDYIERRLSHGRNKGKKQIYEELNFFLERYNIRDLHEDNWILTDYRLPKIMDYGWF